MSMHNDPHMTAATQAFIHELQGNISQAAFDRTTRILFSTDASIYHMMPVGVAWPRNKDEVLAAVDIAARHNIPVLPRGGGSSLAGQAIGHALILDFSRHMDKILEINPERRTVHVQPGVLLGQLNKALRPYQLQFGPDPASADRATMGGIIGNNATGAHSILHGMTHDHLQATHIVLSDATELTFQPLQEGDMARKTSREDREGIIYRTLHDILRTRKDLIKEKFPHTFRSVAGYNLKALLESPTRNPSTLMAGSEGTLGIITSAELGLVPTPPHTHLYLVHFPEMKAALDAVPRILESGPSAVELIDDMLLSLTRKQPKYSHKLRFIEGNPGAVLMVEYQGDQETEVKDQAGYLRTFGSVVHLPRPADQEEVWEARKVGLGIVLSKRGDSKPITCIEDAAVPVEHLTAYALGIRSFAREIGVESTVLYAHASAGCLHIRPVINLKAERGRQQMRALAEKSLELAVKFGGTTSGEHGEGLARGEFTERLFGSALMDTFRQVKDAFDPGNLLNPGKIIHSPAMDDASLLRYGPAYNTPHKPEDTAFHFQEDQGFDGAVEMCNGAGVCRQLEGGVMCPSFQATREEKHSTRGRANALRAAMTGGFGPQGITSREVYQVLDLCLSCQACKSECPSSVDMAKLKAEFLYHYQRQHGVPLRSRIFANIEELYNLFSPLAPLFNAVVSNTPAAFKAALGIHPQRPFPALAQQRFSAWFQDHKDGRKHSKGEEVLFFYDTFLEHNNPEIGQAAVRVLEKAGCQVIVPPHKVDSGRPAVSKGLLDKAKSLAQHNVALLTPYARRGIPIVGCEPSSMAMLTHEYPDLIPGPETQALAAACSMLDAFIVREVREGSIQFDFDDRPRRILFHGHCQQKANYGTRATRQMLSLIPNAIVEETEAGCCGMAGSFGYEKEHYQLSLQIAELTLAPQVRQADPETMICASGTSCREQIRHTTNRDAKHPIQIFAAALR